MEKDGEQEKDSQCREGDVELRARGGRGGESRRIATTGLRSSLRLLAIPSNEVCFLLLSFLLPRDQICGSLDLANVELRNPSETRRLLFSGRGDNRYFRSGTFREGVDERLAILDLHLVRRT